MTYRVALAVGVLVMGCGSEVGNTEAGSGSTSTTTTGPGGGGATTTATSASSSVTSGPGGGEGGAGASGGGAAQGGAGQGGAGGAGGVLCDPGTADCDGDAANGCEIDTGEDPAHCGACDAPCVTPNATPACAGGVCAVGQCTMPFADCDGVAASGCELDVLTSEQHCGACGSPCAPANGTGECSGGQCGVVGCDPGFQDCDGGAANGCEADTNSDVQDCGGCGVVCTAANGTPACTDGACAVAACDPGFDDCDGDAANGCEASLSSASSCGACGNACPGGICSGGSCQVLSACLAIHAADPALPSGVYTIDPNGTPFPVYCDMASDGGGWTYGAIVSTLTDTASQTRVPGVTVFGAPVPELLANEYGVDLSGVAYSEIRIDNFTLPSVVKKTSAAQLVWDATLYASAFGAPAKRVVLDAGFDFRLGYYAYSGLCPLSTINMPMCFTQGNPVEWVCDTDSNFVEGMVDPTGGEICGLYYCKKVWRDSACVSYLDSPAVYGFAIR